MEKNLDGTTPINPTTLLAQLQPSQEQIIFSQQNFQFTQTFPNYPPSQQ
jgi:hypothetical protein